MRGDTLTIRRAIASVFGVGHWPYAPGTWASLIALGPAYLARGVGIGPYLLSCAIAVALAAWAAGGAARQGDEPDPSWIVIDEVVGSWLAVALVDRGNLLWLGAGVLLFRVFDIMKPWPICALDRHVRGGLGIVLDDVAAGLMATLCLLVFTPPR